MMIKLEGIKWVGFVARIELIRYAYKFVRKLKGTDHLDELCVDGSILLKWAIRK